MLKEKIGFIGGGKMGEALMKGILKAKLSSVGNIIVSDVDKKRCQALEDETRIKTTQDNKEVTANSDVIILAVKPNIMGTILEELKNEKSVLEGAITVLKRDIPPHLAWADDDIPW